MSRWKFQKSTKIAKIVNFPKIPKNTSIETSINVLCRTRISNSLRILPLSVFTLERYERLRCSHHFVTFCCNVSAFHMMSPFSSLPNSHHFRCKNSMESALFNDLLRLALFILRFNWPRSFEVIWSHLRSIRSIQTEVIFEKFENSTCLGNLDYEILCK